MLYIEHLIIAGAHIIAKKRFSEFRILSWCDRQLHEQVVHQSLGKNPNPSHPVAQSGEKHTNWFIF